MAAAGQDVHAAQFGLEDFSEFADGMPVLDEDDDEEMAKSYPGVAVILGSSHDLGTGTLFITTRCTAGLYGLLRLRLSVTCHVRFVLATVAHPTLHHANAGGSSGKVMLAADEGCMLTFRTSTCTPSPAISPPPGNLASTCSWSPAPQPLQTQLEQRLTTMKSSPLKCGLCLKIPPNVSHMGASAPDTFLLVCQGPSCAASA